MCAACANKTYYNSAGAVSSMWPFIPMVCVNFLAKSEINQVQKTHYRNCQGSRECAQKYWHWENGLRYVLTNINYFDGRFCILFREIIRMYTTQETNLSSNAQWNDLSYLITNTCWSNDVLVFTERTQSGAHLIQEPTSVFAADLSADRHERNHIWRWIGDFLYP